MKQIFIKDLQNGQVLSGELFGISRLLKNTDRNGRDYLDVDLVDATGFVKGKVWSDALQNTNLKELREGKVCEIYASVQEYKGVLQLNIQSISVYPDEKCDIKDFVATTKKDIDELESTIESFLEKIEDEHIAMLANGLFEKYREEFLKAPAAKSIHHHYLGGYAEHLVEMFEIAEVVVKHYTEADSDLVYAGILLHDFGKIKELQVNGFAVEYSLEGKLIGHIGLGVEMLISYLKENEAEFGDWVSSEKLVIIKHIIYSHHGVLEFGSPVIPKTIEAEIIAKIDDLSSKARLYQRILDENETNDSTFSSWDRIVGGEVYLGEA